MCAAPTNADPTGRGYPEIDLATIKYGTRIVHGGKNTMLPARREEENALGATNRLRMAMETEAREVEGCYGFLRRAVINGTVALIGRVIGPFLSAQDKEEFLQRSRTFLGRYF